jgi:monovalent cation:H+ antiporter, CPA1 family
MSTFSLVALLLTLTALFAYVNYKLIRLPPTVGLTGLSLVFSLLLIGAGELGLPLRGWAAETIANVDFSEALLNGMLSFMLFAGALHVDVKQLREQKVAIAMLATFGVLISTVLVGAGSWLLFGWLGLPMSLLACLTFGALISPTDPIAVLALLKDAKAPISLSTKIAGESLFNDGVGIVVFLVMFRSMFGGAAFAWEETALLLLTEVAGGLAIGLIFGGLCFLMLKSVDNYRVEVMLTLALVTGSYQLASALHASGPLAMVAAGLLIGNYGRKLAMSDITRENLDNFWELLDEILNGILFVLIGFEVLLLKIDPIYLLAAALILPLVLAARLASLSVPAAVMHLTRRGGLPLSLLTWGGLRGGISIALALTLPAGREHDLLLVATYAVVAFSILVQATTTPWVLRKTLARVHPAGWQTVGGRS